MTWSEICANPALQDLPFKIETDRYGRLLMSPARNEHGYYQGEIGFLLRTMLAEGRVLTECAIETSEGVKVADVAWCSAERFQTIRPQISSSVAPEICVEIFSDSNTREEIERKRDLYFSRGALEFWVCDAKGDIAFFTPAGFANGSQLCPTFPGHVD